MSRHRIAGSIVLCSTLLAPFAAAQDAVTAEELIGQLADPQQRAVAHVRLVALGATAVPSIMPKLDSASDAVRDDLLAILAAMGPDASAAVPRLIQRAESGRMHGATFVATLAELIPWRAADVELDLDAMLRSTIQARIQARRGDFSDTPEYAIAYQRLLLRGRFPRQPDLDALLVMVEQRSAMRVELAVEHLGRRGAAAEAALPALRRILERPEPRILTTDRTLPTHRKAARAVLAIAPSGELARVARDTLAGTPPPPVAQPEVPQRVRARIDELVAELAAPGKRASAAANLVALGEHSALPVAALLSTTADLDAIDAALGVLRELGPSGGAAVPQLVDALCALNAAHTVAAFEALIATTPGSRDFLPEPICAGSVGRLTIFGRPLRGTIDASFLTAVFAITERLRCRQLVDPAASLVELEAQLRADSVQVREFALEALAARGEAARGILSALAEMLREDQPKRFEMQWLDRDSATSAQIDCTANVHRLAARAIVAIAPPDDPVLRAAREVLAHQEPK